ncbi:hypothetical protein PoB_002749600 [Plakobranchus ocellatus]|uniref:Uncharacterized protein n=1 Tax=Plakobranchus ocellatus TaxID=259542 RepID=A0AAV4A2R9_9GAST|nr:hypothetical protein PoB_002749600 [Plakobranchus ocellatus]
MSVSDKVPDDDDDDMSNYKSERITTAKVKEKSGTCFCITARAQQGDFRFSYFCQAKTPEAGSNSQTMVCLESSALAFVPYKPAYSKVISRFKALIRQDCRRLGSNPRGNVPCRSQGEFASFFVTPHPSLSPIFHLYVGVYDFCVVG